MKRANKFRSMLILALALLVAGLALAEGAETRDRAIQIEGTEEIIHETYFASENGYSLWIPDGFSVTGGEGMDTIYAADAEEDSVNLTVVPAQIDPAESDAFLAEATGGFDPETAQISDPTEWTLESGLNVKSVEVTFEGEIYRFYLISGEDMIYCLTATFPEEAAEGYGARLAEIVESFEI